MDSKLALSFKVLYFLMMKVILVSCYVQLLDLIAFNLHNMQNYILKGLRSISISQNVLLAICYQCYLHAVWQILITLLKNKVKEF